MQVRTIAYYHWIFPAGGAETVTCNLGRFFETQGLRQIIYTRKLVRELLTDELQRRFDIRELPESQSGATPKNTRYICASLQQEQVDILIAQGATDFPFQEIHNTCSTKIVYCLHNSPFWEVFDLKHQRAADRPYLKPW